MEARAVGYLQQKACEGLILYLSGGLLVFFEHNRIRNTDVVRLRCDVLKCGVKRQILGKHLVLLKRLANIANGIICKT